MPNYEVRKTRNTAWIPLTGFIVLLVLAGFSFFIAPNVARWLSTETWTLGVTRVLPIRFPSAWTEFQVQLSVAAGIFLALFALATIIMIALMGSPMGETDVSLKEIRDRKKQQVGRRRR